MKLIHFWWQGALTHGDRRATETRDLSRFNFDNKVGQWMKEYVMFAWFATDQPLFIFLI